MAFEFRDLHGALAAESQRHFPFHLLDLRAKVAYLSIV
jgi:hypothetical protein